MKSLDLLSLCGIDEAGRGPLAGPMVFAGVVLDKEIDGLNDSKKLSAKKRDTLYEEIIQNSTYKIVFTSASKIDEFGISYCIKSSLKEILDSIKAKKYLFDGNSSYGINELEHLIKADGLIASVSAASILAKVSRDRYMENIASLYPNYSFEKHKGYGTKEHIELIYKYGQCDEHRKSFKLKKEIEEKSLFDI